MSEFHPKNNEELEGRLLVAAPYLEGGGFEHSVIFINHVEEKFLIGHILNHPAHLTVGDVARNTGIPKELNKVPIFKGGPVDRNQLVFAAFIHKKDKLNIIFNLSEEQTLNYLDDPQVSLRAFVGHSAWEAKQIRRELRDRAWYVCSMAPELCMEPNGDAVWVKAMHRLSPLHQIMSHAPVHPALN